MDTWIFDSKFFTHCYCIRIYDFIIIHTLIFIFLFLFLDEIHRPDLFSTVDH